MQPHQDKDGGKTENQMERLSNRVYTESLGLKVEIITGKDKVDERNLKLFR